MAETRYTLSTTINSVIPNEADALLIVPPFVHLRFPSLALHTLQSIAREQGFRISVLYANMALASILGVSSYNDISHGNAEHPLAGEFLLAPFAYGTNSKDSGALDFDRAPHRRKAFGKTRFSFDSLHQFDLVAERWLSELTDQLHGKDIPVIGCTSSFDQTAASIAILNRIKKGNSDVITILGGANCEGEMAEGLAKLTNAPDYIFEGESDATFVGFLADIRSGEFSESKIVSGVPCRNMDKLPRPDFREYFQQLNLFLANKIDPEQTFMTYETSRGCWWGEKAHCTFCGLNGLSMAFREKSPDKVTEDVKALVKEQPTSKIFMTDNIMPHRYFKTVIKRLARDAPGADIFYEQKSNLSLKKILAIKAAGINSIQPGIEALSTAFLKRMKKGVTTAQNIATMRYSCSAGLNIAWNLLYGFPGDAKDEYQDTLDLLPLLTHLKPPVGCFRLSIDRFSPYFERPHEYGISNISPLKGYASAFPPGSDLNKIAYHFTADYDTAADRYPELVEAIITQVDVWQTCWLELNSIPRFYVKRMSNTVFLVHDTRGLPNSIEVQFLTFDQAKLALISSKEITSPAVQLAVQTNWGIIRDSQYIPLATAEPALLQMFEQGSRDRNAVPGTANPDTPIAPTGLRVTIT